MTVTDTRHRVGVYFWSPGPSGVHSFRMGEPLRVLADMGHRVSTGDQLDDQVLSDVDTVVVHTLHGERATEGWQALAALDSHRLVLDIDDAMWSPDWSVFQQNYGPDVLERLWRNVSVAHVVTTPSEVIAEYIATRHGHPNVRVVPNTVPEWLVDHVMPDRDRPTVGYQGSTHHIRDWTGPVQGQVASFLGRHPDWGFHSYGPLRLDAPGRPGMRHTPWIDGVEGYWRSASFDVGIGPLRDTPFNRSKSALRAVEYAALGVVAVLPDLPPYRAWVADGDTGRLVRSHQTLKGVLAEVARDQAARLQMAANARATARTWTTEQNIGMWVQAWASR